MEQAKVSIGVAARMTGVNANTLRMWERRYQLGPSKRSAGGQREYTTTDIDHLRLIKRLMDKGLRIGDVARLSIDALWSLLLDSGDNQAADLKIKAVLNTQVVGIAISKYFKEHIKRYPQLAVECSELDAERWLSDPQLEQKELLIIQQNSLHRKHLESLLKISKRKVHMIILYFYAQKDLVAVLEQQGIIMMQGNIDPARIDDSVNKVLRLASHVSELDQISEAFDISLSKIQPRQFDEEALVEAEALSNKLNCECPPHLTDLIRRLNAFEDYSQTCGAENWKQAAVHACIYSYTNQARYLIEKALRTVLDE